MAALGQAIAAGGRTVPIAELSADGGATWRQVPFSAPGPDTAFTALAAGRRGFTAAGQFGAPGQQQVAAWTSADGIRWSQLPAPLGVSQITALAPSGSVVPAIGSADTPQTHQTVTLTLPVGSW